MFTLYISRVINSKHVEIPQEYEFLADCVNALYDQFWLGARVVGPKGERYKLVEVEDAQDADYVVFHFELES